MTQGWSYPQGYPKGPKPPIYRRKWAQIVGTGFLAFILGAALAASSPPEPTVIEVPGGEPKIETKTVTKTKTVEVERTPQSCLTALNIASEAFTKAGDALIAASAGDSTQFQRFVSWAEEQKPELTVASLDCRSKAE
jgi:hypothetical protein